MAKTLPSAAHEASLGRDEAPNFPDLFCAVLHRIRNLQQNAFSALELLRSRVAEEPESLELIKQVELALAQWRLIEESLRECGLPLTPRREPVDFAQLAENAWRRCQASQPERLVIVPTPHSTQVWGDARLLEGALLAVWRSLLEQAPQADWFRLGVEVDVDQLVARFEADGAMVAPAFLDQWFEPLADAHRLTGLVNLAARRVIESHGGAMCAETNGMGRLVVTLALPREVR